MHCSIHSLTRYSQPMHHHTDSELSYFNDRQPLKLVAYVSRSMTTEQRYAQIEKEALALTWACECFSDYLTGLKFHIHTDHKPLVPLFSTKQLEERLLRVQRFHLRMLRYHFTILHIPGRVSHCRHVVKSSNKRTKQSLLPENKHLR